ncbi:MAG: hypothetical protein PHT79_11910 [Syntrophomonadaceae bacterium]|nr:hypothetical protein [Syntrophomonadaceae bacterium]
MNRVINSIIIILILVSFSIIIFGCSAESQQVNHIYKKENISNQTKYFKNIVPQNDNIFEVNYFPLSVSEEIEGVREEIGGCTVFGNKIYYIVNFPEEQSTIAKLSRVYEYDTITDENKLIYEIKDPEVTWVNELRADEKKLYWTTVGINKYTLESFELKTQKVEKVHSVSYEPRGRPIVLGGNSRYLSWYEYDVATKLFNLTNYNLTEEKISFINEDGIYFYGFARPSINGDEALIIKDVNDKLSFNLINVKNFQIEHKFNLSKEIECIRPQVSNDYIVWNDKLGENIYFYDFKLDDVSKISFRELLDKSVFSMHLYDNILYIRTTTDEDIWFFDLREKNYGIITCIEAIESLPISGDANYSSSKISLDNQYISLLVDYTEQYTKHYACIIVYSKIKV